MSFIYDFNQSTVLHLLQAVCSASLMTPKGLKPVVGEAFTYFCFVELNSVALIAFLLERGRDRLWIALKTITANLELSKGNAGFVITEFSNVYIFIITFYVINCITSIMLGFGAWLCNRCLCFPFIITQIIYFILGYYPFTIFFRYWTYLAFESVDEKHRAKMSLPMVIAMVTMVFLYAAFIIYIASCSYSFVEVVRILKEQDERQKINQQDIPVVFKPHLEVIKENQYQPHFKVIEMRQYYVTYNHNPHNNFFTNTALR